jgi:hypothetical protein
MTAFDDDYREHYRELIEGARDAVGDLLDASDHDVWMRLRVCYGELSDALERADRDGALQERVKRYRQERDEAEDAWRQLSAPARESLVMRVLGDERLIIPELVSRMNAELGYPDGRDEGGRTTPIAVFVSDVRRVVTRMHRAGHLDRVEEPAPGCRIRHRYFRKRALDGPIVELERAYQEGGE